VLLQVLMHSIKLGTMVFLDVSEMSSCLGTNGGRIIGSFGTDHDLTYNGRHQF